MINEIHYRPDVKTELVEFVELFNSGTNAVDLTGWKFTSGIDFVFTNTTIPAAEYIVVAQNPAALKQKFGVTALGPFTGNLSGDGERLVLRDASGKVVDEVNYSLGFPWPTVGDAPGCSIELINPLIDNDLGGSWRAFSSVSAITNEVVTVQGVTNLSPVLSQTASWKYEQSGMDLGLAWQGTSYDDSAWLQGNGVFYREDAVLPWPKNTPVIYNNPQQMTYYFRAHFQCAVDPSTMDGLLLSGLIDDGAVFYLNGAEVGRIGMRDGAVTYNTAASRNVGNATSPETLVVDKAKLVQGDNLLSVEVHQYNNRSSDLVFGLKADLFTLGAIQRITNYVVKTNAIIAASPGRKNHAFSGQIPPLVRQVDHSPLQPKAGEAVKITAKITAPQMIKSVGLLYQLVDPGSYIQLEDAEYKTRWTTISMNDQGIDGDEQAGDDVWTATLSGDIQVHRRLIRYRMSATDTAGNKVDAPYSDDPQPNFAYFVYNGVPAWRGAIEPGSSSADRAKEVQYDTNSMNRVPVYHVISKKASVESAMWTERYSGALYKWKGTLVYDGKVYDHIGYRARGGVWRYAMVKNMWKFDFNRGHDFEPRDNYGRKYDVAWNKLNLGACIQQGDYNHRGEQGMFESVGFKLFELAGVPACATHFIQLRVIDTAVEADPANQYEGDFWGLYLATEQVDGRFLDSHDLPDGNLYKMEGGSGTLNNQGPTAVTNRSDLNLFMTAYNQNPSDDWWRTNLNLLNYYSYQAILQGIHHYDIAGGKNYFYYLNPETSIWSVIPWDLDLTWADNMYNAGVTGGNEPFKSKVLNRASFNLDFYNRVREIRDLLFNTDQAYQLIDEFAAMIRDPQGNPSITGADRALWDYNPKMADNAYTSSMNKAGKGRFYQFPLEPNVPKTFEGTVKLMKNYIVYRSQLMDTWYGDSLIPETPMLTYISTTNYSVNKLEFKTTQFVGKGSSFAAMKWRLGEVSPPDAPVFDPAGPRKYEINAAWESEEISAFKDTFRIPASHAKVGHYYRVRVKMKDTAGRWSHWSNPIEFKAGEPDTILALQENLRITEIMFNSPAGNEYEFVELHNTSETLTLDLSGAIFSQGINFTFNNGTVIAPKSYVVLAKSTDLNLFRTHYGLDGAVHVLGPYSGNLDNAGETLTLRSASGGSTILSFAYRDGRGWPLAADGAGHSLVLAALDTEALSNNYYDYGAHWRMSARIKGSPGGSDDNAPSTVVINEIKANTHLQDPLYPDLTSNDWIELFNNSETNVTVSALYLSDDPGNLKKWQIPAMEIPAKGRISIDEMTGFHQNLNSGFGLSSAGEGLYLSSLPGSNEDRVLDAIEYKGQEVERSWGRYPDGSNYWGPMLPTRDLPNQPFASNLVISEIMYHPQASSASNEWAQGEYIEIANLSGGSINLYEHAGFYRIDGEVSYQFPTNAVISALGRIIIVGFDPQDETLMKAFRDFYQITQTNENVFGPFIGRLANDGGRVALERQDISESSAQGPAWVVIDEVIYFDDIPWPTGPDGSGFSLQRLQLTSSGNDPSNWTGAKPDPGVVADMPVPPVITQQPISVACSTGTNVVFEVVATHPTLPIFYQWLHDGKEISGGTQFILKIDSVKPSHAGKYEVKVRAGDIEVTSQDVQLTVDYQKASCLLSITNESGEKKCLLRVHANVGVKITVESSTNLIQWTILGDRIIDGSEWEVADPEAASQSAKFYRLREEW